MSLTEIAIKRPSLIIVLFTVLLVGGLFSYRQLNYELMPEFSEPMLTITTAYPGASPADVEETVTKKVEDVIAEVENVKSITSQSMEGYSIIITNFKMGTDIDEKQQDLQRRLNNLLSQLPDEVKTPNISKVSPSDQPIMQVLATAALSESDFFDLMVNEILPQMQQITGVGQINVLGGREREIQVNVDQDKLDFYGLSLLQITSAINRANADFPTGKVKSREAQITVRLAGKFGSVDEIRELVVSNTPTGPVRVRDVADVADVIRDASSISRINGQNGIGLQIKKQNDANAVAISAGMKELMQTLEKKYQARGLHFDIADDTSDFTLQSVDAVEHDLVIAVVLVAAVMLLFLHTLRDSLIVLISIPTSLISTFIAMYLLGYSINLMTLLAMSLVIGILVDDSIVVLENIHRHLEMGKDRRTAALDGRNEIGFSAVAITLVDVVVFLPIALINTTIGEILRQYSITIVVSTLMSLLVCFTLTPWLASRFGKATHLDPSNWLHRPLIWFESLLTRLSQWYLRRLKWALQHKLLSGGIIVATFGVVGLVMQMGILGQELVAQGDQGKFTMKLEYDKSTTLTQNNLLTKQIEDYLLAQPEVRTVFANVAGPTTGGMGASASVGEDRKSDLTIMLVDKKARTLSTEQYMIRVRDELEKKFPAIKINSTVVGIAGGGDAPIQIVLSGDHQQEVMAAGKKLEKLVQQQPGANDVQVSVEEGNPEVNVSIDREKMAKLGLDVSTVGATMQTAFTGNDDAKYRVGNNEYDIRVRLDEFDRRNPEDVANITFLNNLGQQVKLSQFAEITQSSGPSMLERKDRRTSVTIKARNLGITSGVLSQNIQQAMQADPLPASIAVKWSGDIERQADSFGALGMALGAALLLIYLVMVALYDSFVYPFVVLFSIPVALIGAFLALNLAMSSMSIFTMLGLIMLLGLVTKNAILLVDFANQKKAEGMSTTQALLLAGETRLRPILMTTIAMVIGMLPIALAKGAGAEWKNGLALVLIGGLTSSLMLTVFVVPMMYYVIDMIKYWFARRQKTVVREPKSTFTAAAVPTK